MRVVAAPPVRKRLRLQSTQPGQVEAFERTLLFSKLAAYVREVHVDIGDSVADQQLLVELAVPELEEELAQKEAAVAQAKAEIALAAAVVRQAEAAIVVAQANVSAAEASLRRAQADVERWESQYRRIRELSASGALDQKIEEETRNALRAAEAARLEAEAKQASAHAALAESQAGLARSKAGEAVAAARLQSALADLARQKTLLQYTQVRSPYAGVVTERLVQRGDFVQPPGNPAARPMLVVARTDIVRIFVDVPEMEARWIAPGLPGYVHIQALPDAPLPAKVTRLSWALGPNRTLRTELDLPNPQGRLRPGMYATVQLVLQERSDALVVPLSAIVRDGETPCCWVVRQGHLARTPVSLGVQTSDEVEITSGLSGEEQVVQNPSAALQEGIAAQVVEPATR